MKQTCCKNLVHCCSAGLQGKLSNMYCVVCVPYKILRWTLLFVAHYAVIAEPLPLIIFRFWRTTVPKLPWGYWKIGHQGFCWTCIVLYIWQVLTAIKRQPHYPFTYIRMHRFPEQPRRRTSAECSNDAISSTDDNRWEHQNAVAESGDRSSNQDHEGSGTCSAGERHEFQRMAQRKYAQRQ